MPAVKLSGFADEIAADPREQIATLQQNQIRYLELRGVWNTNVLDLKPDRIDEFRHMLDDAGIGVSAIGSPIGKVPIRSDLDAHFARFQVAVERACQFATAYVRVFSFYHPDESAEDCRSAVIEQFSRMTEYAAGAEVVLLHENEKGIFGDIPSRCHDLLTVIDHDHLRATFDPANFIQAGIDPATEAWPDLREYVACFHIKDALKRDKRVVPAGCGDGGLEPILAQAVAAGFRGFCSLEPHLKAEDPDYGGSGAERFSKAAGALRAVLAAAGIDTE